jgi:hypothetical protein
MIGCNWWAFELLKIEKLGARRLEKKYPENKCPRKEWQEKKFSAEEIVILQKKIFFFILPISLLPVFVWFLGLDFFLFLNYW